MLQTDSKGEEQLKLIDFGLARELAALHSRGIWRGMTEGAFTPHWAPPEQEGTDYNLHKADVYAIGRVIVAMLWGFAAFKSEDPGSGLPKPHELMQLNSCSDELLELLRGCLSYDWEGSPEDGGRWDSNELRRCAWVQQSTGGALDMSPARIPPNTSLTMTSGITKENLEAEESVWHVLDCSGHEYTCCDAVFRERYITQLDKDGQPGLRPRQSQVQGHITSRELQKMVLARANREEMRFYEPRKHQDDQQCEYVYIEVGEV